jgi:hypothetical protein
MNQSKEPNGDDDVWVQSKKWWCMSGDEDEGIVTVMEESNAC